MEVFVLLTVMYTQSRRSAKKGIGEVLEGKVFTYYEDF
jgi:hypothetical protein